MLAVTLEKASRRLPCVRIVATDEQRVRQTSENPSQFTHFTHAQNKTKYARIECCNHLHTCHYICSLVALRAEGCLVKQWIILSDGRTVCSRTCKAKGSFSLYPFHIQTYVFVVCLFGSARTCWANSGHGKIYE